MAAGSTAEAPWASTAALQAEAVATASEATAAVAAEVVVERWEVATAVAMVAVAAEARAALVEAVA